MAVLGTLTGGGGDTSLNVESTTRVSFSQTAAPTGWTKSTSHNDKILRVVSGTVVDGGTQAFSSVFGSGKSSSSHTLSTPQITSHGHSYGPWARGPESGGGSGSNFPTSRTGVVGYTAPAVGGSQGHSHTLSLDIQYVDVIIAEKD